MHHNLKFHGHSSEQVGAICPNCEMSIMSFPCLICGYRPIPSTDSEKDLEEVTKLIFNLVDAAVSKQFGQQQKVYWRKLICDAILNHTQSLRLQLVVAVEENEQLKESCKKLSEDSLMNATTAYAEFHKVANLQSDNEELKKQVESYKGRFET